MTHLRSALIAVCLAAVCLLAAPALADEPAGAPEPFGALPSPQQLAWHDYQFYAFVHFNMNTFTGVEWGDGEESPKHFNPTELDCDQWCKLFKECGLTGVILTAKHHDGFCLWPSEFTEHDVANSPWRDGKGDVVRELAEACKKNGLWMGVYISPWDRNNPIYGRDDEAYNRYYIGQMEELLTGYGDIAEVWWDGANGDRNNPDKHQEYDWPAFVATVRRLQPQALIFAPPYSGVEQVGLRWVGNESGIAGETQWSTYPINVPEVSRTLNVGIEGADTWLPAETDVSIRPGWYWTADTDNKVKSPEKLLDIYYKSVGRNTNLLLNFPVDNRGLVHENDAAALRQMTDTLKQTFANDLASGKAATADHTRSDGQDGAFSAANVTDNNPATYWSTDDGQTTGAVTIDIGAPARMDRVVLQEHIELGQRVRAWELETRVDGEWRKAAEGTTIGHKRIATFDPVTADAVRLTITDSLACPTIETVGVFASPE